MKKIRFIKELHIILLSFLLSYAGKAQNADTLFCVIDTTASYVTVNLINQEHTSDPAYFIEVKSNYLQNNPQCADRAKVYLQSCRPGGIGFPLIKKVTRKQI